MKLIVNRIESIKHDDFKEIDIEDIKKLQSSYYFDSYKKYFIYIKDVMYHVKKQKKNIRYLVNELLGKLISEYFGAETLESKIIKDECDDYYLITDNFIKYGHKYTNLNKGRFTKFKYIDESSNLLDIENLDLIQYGKNVVKVDLEDFKNLKKDLKIMLVSDFIRKQSDRVFRNFMIEYNKNRVKLMPLYDFEHSFLDYSDYLINTFNFNFSSNHEINYLKEDFVFQELLYKAIDLDIKIIFEQLMSKYPILINSNDIYEYSNVIREKQDEIKRYKLIR